MEFWMVRVEDLFNAYTGWDLRLSIKSFSGRRSEPRAVTTDRTGRRRTPQKACGTATTGSRAKTVQAREADDGAARS